jgi:MYXO-CTERM domain-containing protein
VTDDAGPVEGATVKLDGGTSVVTDATGAFLFTKATAGDHVISASAEGHTAKMVDVTVAAKVRAEVDIVLDIDDTGSGSGGEPPGGDGGCSTTLGGPRRGTTGGASPLLLLALFALRRRRA